MAHETQPTTNENRPTGLKTVAETVKTLGALSILRNGLYANENPDEGSDLYEPFQRALIQIEKQEPEYLDLLATGLMASDDPAVREGGVEALCHWHCLHLEGDPGLIAAEITRWQQALQDPDERCRYDAAYYVDVIGEKLNTYDHDSPQHAIVPQYRALLGDAEHALLLEGPTR